MISNITMIVSCGVFIVILVEAIKEIRICKRLKKAIADLEAYWEEIERGETDDG